MDIVNDLREYARHADYDCDANMFSDAADEIARLRTEVEALRAEIEALRVDVKAWKASHSMLTDTCHHFQAQAKRLAEALRHQRWCRTCGEDGWDSCEEGRAAIDLLQAAYKEETND